ncbi:MAG: hypothetical protein IJR44_02690, partial [Neisseriaceae bacterium]|nr:hypothetical protein [Neisseriaceae bacterium]
RQPEKALARNIFQPACLFFAKKLPKLSFRLPIRNSCKTYYLKIKRRRVGHHATNSTNRSR